MDLPLENILIGDSVYITGHIKPDVDAIVSAYAYQIYRHSRGDFNYVAIRCDEPNHVTTWLFKKFQTEMPMLVRDVSGRKIVLVDHTDPEQRPVGWDKADIIEVLDHHKLKLETSVPPKITIRPYGSTSTLIAKKMLDANIKITPELAALLLGAVLDDTLALRSPITTFQDKNIAGQLAAISGLNDISKFAREMFAQKDIWSKMKSDQIINTDTKAYDMNGTKVQISQVETMDNQDLYKRKGSEIQKVLKDINSKDEKDIRIVMLTDLIRNDCIMIVQGSKSNDLEKIFNVKVESNTLLLPGVVSRKRQVEAPLIQYYS